MITDINTINTPFWQTSTAEFGSVAIDIADINQSIAIILSTVKGSDPWRPTFGSDLINFVDLPLPVAVARISTAIKVDVPRWEPRVNVIDVDVEISDSSTLHVSIQWEFVTGEIPGGIVTVSINAGGMAPPPPDDSTLLGGGSITTPIQFSQWQLSTRAYGERLEGIADINQSVLLILSTIPGSDPWRPTFGSDIWEFIDTPLPVAVAGMKKAIVRAIDIWEHRIIRVTQIEHIFQSQPGENLPAGIIFNVGWEFIDGTPGQTELLIGFPAIGQDEQTNINFLILLLENGEPLLYENDNFILLENQPGE